MHEVPPPRRPSVVIRNVEILDGTGHPPLLGDIRISGTTITAVVDPDSSQDRPDIEVIDGNGLTACPGFIDVHSHADNSPFLDADDTSKILQGVTTEVVGNCGFSLAPTFPATASLFRTYSQRLFPPIAWAWSSFREMLEAADERGYVTNYAPLLGHHAVRIAVMGMLDRPPDRSELSAMSHLVTAAVDAGAIGLSTGLIYPPGLFAAADEIIALVRRLPEDFVYATHVRGEGPQVLKSLAEAVSVGERTGRPVQISHLKVGGRLSWGTMPRAFELLDAARARGVKVRQDVYPYTAASTMLTATLPPWFQEGGDKKVLQRLRNARDLGRLRDDLATPSETWENYVAAAGWEGIVIASSPSHSYDGLSLAGIASRQGTDPVTALAQVLLAESLQVSMVVHHMSEDDLVVALRHPLTMIGTDGLPPGTGGKPHPRRHGSFPRVVARFVRESPVLSLPEAVRRMTSLPAATFGLTGRGTIRPGMAADVVVFDSGVLRDTATFDEPTRSPVGISTVIVNGVIVVRDGTYVGPRAGERLTRRYSATVM